MIFCQSNSELIEQIGLPSLVIEDYDAFIYLLMHGALWPNAPVEFDVDKLDKEKRWLYLLLLDRYFEAGLINPGLSLAQEDLNQLEIDYSKQFDWRKTHE
ncbi:hypothetical protein B1R32_10876 [Abditibacterium utsteinense]|uniref:Uncharacterized protein n=1 Tax=Abditibacterium utsteinense TaxID=1960156 RepID=A0A2S8ST02_9BACT|nr:hypothetical protein [Abditibacterium utsteinense]PQV63869.1 hypothetical protein B1R32_10876 [Abditibacterium utsteinense]